MRYVLVAALVAQLGPLAANSQARAPSLDNGRTAPMPYPLVSFTFLAMLIWLRVAICPLAFVYRTQIPF
jgi:hypothetical protein